MSTVSIFAIGLVASQMGTAAVSGTAAAMGVSAVAAPTAVITAVAVGSAPVGVSAAAVGTVATVGVATSPLILVLATGMIALSAVGIVSKAIEKQRRNEQKKFLLQVNDGIVCDMTAQIGSLSNTNVQESLLRELKKVSGTIKADIESCLNKSPECAFREIRQRIISEQMDEKMIRALSGLQEEKCHIPTI